MSKPPVKKPPPRKPSVPGTSRSAQPGPSRRPSKSSVAGPSKSKQPGPSKVIRKPPPQEPPAPPTRENIRRREGEFFYQNSIMAYGLLPFLPADQREIVKKWMNKLNSLNASPQESTIRNDYMWFLLTQLQGGTVTIPFAKEPPESIKALNTVVEKDIYTNVLAAANKALQYLEEDKERLLRRPSSIPDIDHPLQNDKRYKCKPSKFLQVQPRPKIGFIAYGSCFSNQYS